ncbi:hypothetical protein NLI96_g4597 [Meripilus lineatus]|uniref:Uncharacterized protein n=1 Tax=Meripilus lineatus TaxID=2056292 RepID=A0AAD5V6A2_9APHY|nr:hypothetical protein NLI96_g4597 [Physisporinus lineatus]
MGYIYQPLPTSAVLTRNGLTPVGFVPFHFIHSGTCSLGVDGVRCTPIVRTNTTKNPLNPAILHDSTLELLVDFTEAGTRGLGSFEGVYWVYSILARLSLGLVLHFINLSATAMIFSSGDPTIPLKEVGENQNPFSYSSGSSHRWATLVSSLQSILVDPIGRANPIANRTSLS